MSRARPPRLHRMTPMPLSTVSFERRQTADHPAIDDRTRRELADSCLRRRPARSSHTARRFRCTRSLSVRRKRPRPARRSKPFRRNARGQPRIARRHEKETQQQSHAVALDRDPRDRWTVCRRSSTSSLAGRGSSTIVVPRRPALYGAACPLSMLLFGRRIAEPRRGRQQRVEPIPRVLIHALGDEVRRETGRRSYRYSSKGIVATARRDIDPRVVPRVDHFRAARRNRTANSRSPGQPSTCILST